MTNRNGIRIDVLTRGKAEDAGIELMVRIGGITSVFTLKELLVNELAISKDYDDDRMNFIRCLINEGHRLHEVK